MLISARLFEKYIVEKQNTKAECESLKTQVKLCNEKIDQLEEVVLSFQLQLNALANKEQKGGAIIPTNKQQKEIYKKYSNLDKTKQNLRGASDD